MADALAAKSPSHELPLSKGEVSSARFLSKSLGVEKNYVVYLPSSYSQNDARYPVIYMLHGLGGHEGNWTRHMQLAQAADALALQAIVVMPDGDASFYMNSNTPADYDTCVEQGGDKARSECVKTALFEDYIAQDLIAEVDSKYRTRVSHEQRAIGGLSMGGYGALMLAMRHKDIYSSVASHSGVASLLYQGPDPFQSGKVELAKDPVAYTAKMGRFGQIFLGIFGPELEHWQQYDPAYLVNSLQDGELAIYVDCGTEDEFNLFNGASHLHHELLAKGIAHEFFLVPGHHNVEFWAERITTSLAFHARHFSRQAKTK